MASPIRLPPQTIGSEKALLGALLIRSKAMPDIVDSLSSEALYVQKHAILYRAMLALWGKNKLIDIESVRAKQKILPKRMSCGKNQGIWI